MNVTLNLVVSYTDAEPFCGAEHRPKENTNSHFSRQMVNYFNIRPML